MDVSLRLQMSEDIREQICSHETYVKLHQHQMAQIRNALQIYRLFEVEAMRSQNGCYVKRN